MIHENVPQITSHSEILMYILVNIMYFLSETEPLFFKVFLNLSNVVLRCAVGRVGSKKQALMRCLLYKSQ